MRPARVALEAPFRLLSGEGLGDQLARRRIPPGELDAGSLANHAASAIASDEILRADTPAVGQLDVDTVVVLREAGHRTLAIDRHPRTRRPSRPECARCDFETGPACSCVGWGNR